MTDITPDAASTLGKIDLPDALKPIATNPFAPFLNSKNPGLAKDFVALMLFSECRHCKEANLAMGRLLPHSQKRSWKFAAIKFQLLLQKQIMDILTLIAFRITNGSRRLRPKKNRRYNLGVRKSFNIPL